ncbi:Conserved_hypothetical protein [Hexamita inflata]|uniref:Uncharacterized protein n=1 Tax=Hexamita inflata TaxID=28002 RepID=A0AA86QXC1_9EUKA|nr:Conserved hypothetical protein [Hexamita inflata]
MLSEQEYKQKMIELLQNQIDSSSITFYDDPCIQSLTFFECLNQINQNQTAAVMLSLNQSTILFKNYIQRTVTFNHYKDCIFVTLKFQIYSVINQSIENLISFQQLQELDLSYNESLMLSGIQHLTRLEKLNLCDCNLVNISELEHLANLKYVDLSFNDIDYFSPLKNFVKLKYLDLDYCSVQYFHSFSRFVNLNTLSLVQCKITDFKDYLKLCINLKTLNNKYNDQFRLEALQHYVQLTSLDLSSCNIYEISALRPLVNLEELNLSFNHLLYITPLKSLLKLNILNVENNFISEFTADSQNKNFGSFEIKEQSQPLQEQMRLSNLMQTIDSSATLLRSIRKYHVNHNIIKCRDHLILKQFLEILHKQNYAFLADFTSFFSLNNVEALQRIVLIFSGQMNESLLQVFNCCSSPLL